MEDKIIRLLNILLKTITARFFPLEKSQSCFAWNKADQISNLFVIVSPFNKTGLGFT